MKTKTICGSRGTAAIRRGQTSECYAQQTALTVTIPFCVPSWESRQCQPENTRVESVLEFRAPTGNWAIATPSAK